MAKDSLAKEKSIKNALSLAVYLLIFWGLYRLMIRLPEEIEEVIIKPILWLGPLVLLLKKERASISSLGLTSKNLFQSVYFALGLGAIFVIEAVILNFVKHGGLDFGANIGNKTLLISLALSFATAFSEEISFRGYIFQRLWKGLGNELWANLISSGIWALIHLPWLIFILKLDPQSLIVNFVITLAFGIGSAFIFARTKNIASSIFLHVLWAWPITLFR